MKNKKIIALGYHSVGNMHPRLSVPPELFEKHMLFLKKNGFTCLQFRDVSEMEWNGNEVPNKIVVVYFDDGYKDVYKNAYPILKKLGIQSTIFIVTDFIDGVSMPKWAYDFDTGGESLFLAWSDICDMSDVFEIGTHTKSHKKLSKLPVDDIENELAESSKIIERNVGHTVTCVSFPHSSLNMHIKQIVKRLKFRSAISFGRGYTHVVDLPFFNKIPVGPKDNMILFFLKLHVYQVVRFFERVISSFKA